jgi:hypothetical protein
MKIKSIIRNPTEESQLTQKLLFEKWLDEMALKFGADVRAACVAFGIELEDDEYVNIIINNNGQFAFTKITK